MGRWEQAVREEPLSLCSRGSPCPKGQSPCAVPSGILRWPVSLAGESTRSQSHAGRCGQGHAHAGLRSARLCQTMLLKLLGRVLPGQDRPATVGC